MTINFFTPISDSSHPHLTRVDDYFFLGGKKAHVIHNEDVVLSKGYSPFLLTVLKVISYLTVIIPLIMLACKAALRASHHYRLVDPKAELEKGLEVSQNTIEKLHQLIPKVIAGEADPEIHRYRSQNIVFKLRSVPGMIFKMAGIAGRCRGGKLIYGSQVTQHRFENMVKAKEVCLAHHLDKLVVPSSRLLSIDGHLVIAEEELSCTSNESAQERLYQKLEYSQMEALAKELTVFIAKTGFSDVEWRNMPILNDGSARIGLVDLEEMEGADEGIFGGLRRGLIHCLNQEEHIDAVIALARKLGLSCSDAKRCKRERLKEVRLDIELEQYYARNGIVENPKKPIQVDDLSTLGLDPEECKMICLGPQVRDGKLIYPKEEVSLGHATRYVIDQINEAIQQAPENSSTKGKRHLLLNSNLDELGSYDRASWLRRIIDALVAKGYLFRLETVNGHGYFIQA